MPITPDLLTAAAADPASPAWDVIWQESGDQGSSDPESAVLLPWLAATCAALTPHDREKPLALAGFIAAGASDEDRATYATKIDDLRTLAVADLPGASSGTTFVYLQQSVLGFDGDETWSRNLDRLNDGETDVECPGCEETVLLDLQDAEDSPIEPGLSAPLAQHLHAEATAAGHEEVATALTYLFGEVTCPSCGVRFTVADHLAGV
jgi:hypothetical protein